MTGAHCHLLELAHRLCSVAGPLQIADRKDTRVAVDSEAMLDKQELVRRGCDAGMNAVEMQGSPELETAFSAEERPSSGSLLGCCSLPVQQSVLAVQLLCCTLAFHRKLGL